MQQSQCLPSFEIDRLEWCSLWSMGFAKPCLKQKDGKKDRKKKPGGGVYTWSRIHWKREVWFWPLSACTSSSLAWVEWSMSQYCSTTWSSSPTFHFFSLTRCTTDGSWNSKHLWLKQLKDTEAITYTILIETWLNYFRLKKTMLFQEHWNKKHLEKRWTWQKKVPNNNSKYTTPNLDRCIKCCHSFFV